MYFGALRASIAFSVTLLVGSLTSGALAATTIWWSGDSNFNENKIEFKAIMANELVDITGYGRYEGCCTKQTTTFELYLLIGEGKNKAWQLIDLPWTQPADESPAAMDDLVPKAIKFSDKPVYVSGIKLTSNPFGQDESKKNKKEDDSKDFNFTNFNFVPFLLSQNKCGMGKEDDDCDDNEHEDHKGTGFVFCSGTDCPADRSENANAALLPTPLPATLPLMGSVLGGFALARWRRRRKRAV